MGAFPPHADDIMKRRPSATPALARTSQRAQVLIESMLREMQRGLREPSRLESPAWEQLFGAKQSMVSNLQKLVQALAALPLAGASDASPPPAEPLAADALTAEEMALLAAWLAENN
jgi:hypothetical protein